MTFPLMRFQDQPQESGEPSATQMGETAWQGDFGDRHLTAGLFPWCLVRVPGLPVAAVAPMADVPAMQRLTRALTEPVTGAAAARFTGQVLPVLEQIVAGDRTERARLAKIRVAVAAGQALGSVEMTRLVARADRTWAQEWAEAVRQCEEQWGQARAAHGAAVEAGRAHLADRARQLDVEQAVFLSSRDYFDTSFQKHVRPEYVSEHRKAVDKAFATAARYLRRLTVRCETTSTFGPVHFVRLRPDVDEPVRFDPAVPERMVVEPSAWLLSELGRMAARQKPLSERVLRRSPVIVEDPAGLRRLLDGRRLPLGPPARAFWKALDGRRTVSEIAAGCGLDSSEVKKVLRELSGAVIRADEVAPHDLDAFGTLQEQDESSGGPVQTVAALLAEYETAGWPDRVGVFDRIEDVVRGLGMEARRGQGQHYVDRYVVHEERSHPLSARTTLGAPVVAGLKEALGDIVPVTLLGALLAREDAREAVREHLDGCPAPLMRLLQADIQTPNRRALELKRRLRDLVGRRTVDGVARLDRTDVAQLTRDLWPELGLEAGDEQVSLPGPDLMALGPPETASWLLSELHDDGTYLAGGVTRLHPDGPAVGRDLLNGLVRLTGPDTMAPVVSRRRNKFLVPELPGTAIELSGRSLKPREYTVPISEVSVTADGAAVIVRGRRMRLYPGDIPSVVHRALALPSLGPIGVGDGPRTPRIMIGSTVLQRATWRLRLPGRTKGFDGWKALHEIRLAHDLPRRVFVRHPAEKKPLYLDFADAHAVEDVARLPGADVMMSEMLPEPEQLWFDTGAGVQCAELRTACFVRLSRPAA